MPYLDSSSTGSSQAVLPHSDWPHPTPEQLDNDAAFVEYQAHLSRRAEAAAWLVVALGLAGLGMWFALGWLGACESGPLCAAAPLFLAARRVRAGGAPPSPPPSACWTSVQRAVDAARCAGHRNGYISGWRWGAVCGMVFGVLVSALVVGAVWGSA